MNKSNIKALGVTQQEIDALEVILKNAIPGGSVAVAYLQAVLRALESADTVYREKGLETQVGLAKNNPLDDADKKRKPVSLDSLGGGNIL